MPWLVKKALGKIIGNPELLAKIVLFLLKQMAKRTETNIDDQFIELFQHATGDHVPQIDDSDVEVDHDND